MKLWLLVAKHENPYWNRWRNKCFAMVVRAETEEAARKEASLNHAAENPAPWLDDEFTSCKELNQQGEQEVIIRNVHWS